MNGKRAVLLAGAAIAVIAGVLAFCFRPFDSGEDATGGVALPTASPAANEPPPVSAKHSNVEGQDEHGSGEVVPTAVGTTTTIRQRFRDSTDYAAFIDSVLSDARAGDMDAQYYVYAALHFCDMEFRALFKRRTGPGWLTRDEALNRTARLYRQSFSWTESVEQKCRTLMAGSRADLGDSRKWLEDAATQDQPVAMATLAGSQLVDSSVGKIDKNAAAGAKDLLLSALRSKDPEVMWRIGDLQGFLNPDSEESGKAQWAWWLAACERGYECGPQAVQLEFSCRYENCPPGETVVEYMKRFLQTDYVAVEELARDINADIDAENWAELESSIRGKS